MVVFKSTLFWAGPGLLASDASVSVLLLWARDWRSIDFSSSICDFDSLCAWLKVFSKAMIRSILDWLALF